MRVRPGGTDGRQHHDDQRHDCCCHGEQLFRSGRARHPRVRKRLDRTRARNACHHGRPTRAAARSGWPSEFRWSAHFGASAVAGALAERDSNTALGVARMIKCKRRGIALISVLLATTLLLALLAFAVNVGTLHLRRTTEDVWALQAQAGADGAVGWFRALLAQRQGDVAMTLADVAAAHSAHSLAIDSRTHVDAFLSIHLDTPAAVNDHLDIALQQNAYVNEAPLQVSVTATVVVDGVAVAARS